MQTQRRQQPSTLVSTTKKPASAQQQRDTQRRAPIVLDERELRHVAGGLLPAKTW